MYLLGVLVRGPTSKLLVLGFQTPVAKVAMQRCYTPEAMHRYRNHSATKRKMRSTRITIVSRERYYRYNVLSDTARQPVLQLRTAIACHAGVASPWQYSGVKGLFCLDIFSSKAAPQRQLRRELFSSFLRFIYRSFHSL